MPSASRSVQITVPPFQQVVHAHFATITSGGRTGSAPLLAGTPTASGRTRQAAASPLRRRGAARPALRGTAQSRTPCYIEQRERVALSRAVDPSAALAKTLDSHSSVYVRQVKAGIENQRNRSTHNRTGKDPIRLTRVNATEREGRRPSPAASYSHRQHWKTVRFAAAKWAGRDFGNAGHDHRRSVNASSTTPTSSPSRSQLPAPEPGINTVPSTQNTQSNLRAKFPVSNVARRTIGDGDLLLPRSDRAG